MENARSGSTTLDDRLEYRASRGDIVRERRAHSRPGGIVGVPAIGANIARSRQCHHRFALPLIRRFAPPSPRKRGEGVRAPKGHARAMRTRRLILPFFSIPVTSAWPISPVRATWVPPQG